MDNRAIGVYDSGMGGLIVLETLIDKFPNENFVFIADGRHYPYGTKTAEEIEGYNLDIAKYLQKENVKAICIACNTASANASKLEKYITIPLIKAITPNVKHVANSINPTKNNILILATILTTKSKIYEDELDKYFKDTPHNYYSVAAQNFVNIVEKGNAGTEKSFQEVQDTLKEYLDKDIDKIVLGCTHFPKLINEIAKLFPNALIFDSAVAMADELKMKLNNNLNEQNKKATIKLLTTGDLEQFKTQTQWFKYIDCASYQKIEL